MKKILLTIIVCLNFINSEGSSTDSLNVLKVTNSDFRDILHDILRQEMKCPYFEKSLIFSINIITTDSSAYQIQIGTVGNRLIEIGSESGCFSYEGHLFVVKGGLPATLFKKISKFKTIEFYKPEEGYDSKRNLVILDSIEDDSYSYWTYLYRQGDEFALLEKHSFCQ